MTKQGAPGGHRSRPALRSGALHVPGLDLVALKCNSQFHVAIRLYMLVEPCHYEGPPWRCHEPQWTARKRGADISHRCRLAIQLECEAKIIRASSISSSIWPQYVSLSPPGAPRVSGITAMS